MSDSDYWHSFSPSLSQAILSAADYSLVGQHEKSEGVNWEQECFGVSIRHFGISMDPSGHPSQRSGNVKKCKSKYGALLAFWDSARAEDADLHKHCPLGEDYHHVTIRLGFDSLRSACIFQLKPQPERTASMTPSPPGSFCHTPLMVRPL